MGNLLRHRRRVCRRPDRIAVRGFGAHCRGAVNPRCGGDQRRIPDADDCPFRCRIAPLGTGKCSVANNISLCNSLGLTGLGGLAYTVIVIRRMRRQAAYKPQFEDWLFHVLLPIVAYVILVLSAIAAPSYTHETLLGVGASTLLLLFIGIHNAWDAVSYNVFVTRRNAEIERGRDEISAKKKS